MRSAPDASLVAEGARDARRGRADRDRAGPGAGDGVGRAPDVAVLAAVPTGVATGAVLPGYLGGIERIPSQRQQRVQHVTDRRAVPQE
jgi:hypothetical protein